MTLTFEELGYTESDAKQRIIKTARGREKLLELIDAFEKAGDMNGAGIARNRYQMFYAGRERERHLRFPLATDRGIRINPHNIVEYRIDFTDFVSAVNRSGFCLQPGCTTCGNMEFRNACRNLGRESLIQLMLNTETWGLVDQFRNSVYIWTINLQFPGAYEEYKERREGARV